MLIFQALQANELWNSSKEFPVDKYFDPNSSPKKYLILMLQFSFQCGNQTSSEKFYLAGLNLRSFCLVLEGMLQYLILEGLFVKYPKSNLKLLILLSILSLDLNVSLMVGYLRFILIYFFLSLNLKFLIIYPFFITYFIIQKFRL